LKTVQKPARQTSMNGFQVYILKKKGKSMEEILKEGKAPTKPHTEKTYNL
jgi:predicted transcriptional regulator with HTH domain